MAIEGGAVVGGASLGAVDKGEASLEGVGHQFGPQGLAGVGGHDHQGLALEVEFLVFFGVDPGCDPLDLLAGGIGHRLDC
jgi:hypothetical protein